MNVKYEDTTAEEATHEAMPFDPSTTMLPNHLLSRLKEAAKDYQITEFNQCLDEAYELGTDGQRFAVYLRQLVDSYDFERIISTLQEEHIDGSS